MAKSFLSRFASSLAPLVVMAVGLSSTGCIKKILLNGQIEGTRKGSAAMQTTADFEVARIAASAGIAQFEGMHLLAPSNEDGYFLLVRGWASYAFAFVEDDMEIALLEGKDDMATYHRERGISAYTRAIEYAKQWMESKHPGFEDAAKTGKEETMVEYIKQFDDESDADILFWVGYAWMARANLDKIKLAGTVYAGRVIIERVVELKDDIENGSAHVLLGAFSARTGIATLGEDSFKASKAHYDKATQINGGKVLLGQVQMARTFVCRGKDESPGRKDSFAQYTKLLNDVLAADDPLPEARLTNAIAKRKARRYASKKWIEEFAREDCGWDLSLATPAAPPA
jgi:hypothetical protein